MNVALFRDVLGSNEHQPAPCEPRAGRAVLLINLGSPAAATGPAVREYLREFLSDPAVIQLPRLLRWFHVPLGRLIARLRCNASAAMYQTIWTPQVGPDPGGSPLLELTHAQVLALQEAMPRGWRVYFAMRYGHPSIPETLARIEAEGIEELVIVPMYPQYSGPTTGTAMRAVYDYLGNDDHPLQVTTRLSWYNDHNYVSAQARLLQQYAGTHGLAPDNTYLLFSAHGLPVSYVRKGDPYPDHIAKTVALVADQCGWPSDRMSLAFQSRFGPAKWLQPYTDHELTTLSGSGERRILVCPISFTVDCLETLEEIDVRYRKLVEQQGAELFLCPALNSFQPFISALKHLVLQGCSPISGDRPGSCNGQPRKDGETAGAVPIDSLIMIGASTAGRFDQGRGPKLRHVDADTLRKLKRPACDVPELLRQVAEAAGLREAFVWNTCHRFELYGWVSNANDPAALKRSGDVVRGLLIGNQALETDGVNVLVGPNAHHHLLRTASGLNSGLPGERDVLAQLQAAHRLAERAGTAGSLIQRLVQHALAHDRAIRDETAWGTYNPDYAQIALQYVADHVKFDWLNCRVVVMGGSTTSAAVLRALTDHFGMSTRQLTLVYRGHKNSNHLKLLRKAIGQGRRVRIQTYGEAIVDRAIGEADIVVFGIDREQPILEWERLERCRTAGAKPLTIVDFNTFGSTRELEERSGVRLFELDAINQAVNASAAAMCADVGFRQAYGAAEDTISRVVKKVEPYLCDASTAVGRTSRSNHPTLAR